jgi:hypothetical protein
MKTTEEIIEIIQDKINDIDYINRQTRMSENYYIKNDSKIEVLEEIIRLITD